jgi:hypothetical protein
MSLYVASPEFRTIIYPLEPPQITRAVQDQLAADHYTIKDEFHVTIVNSEVGRRLSKAQFNTLSNFFDDCAGIDIQYVNALHELEKPKVVDGRIEPRRSIVAQVATRTLPRILQEARLNTRLDVPYPFPHVTIATKPDTGSARWGIGIASEAEWIELAPLLYETEWLA